MVVESCMYFTVQIHCIARGYSHSHTNISMFVLFIFLFEVFLLSRISGEACCKLQVAERSLCQLKQLTANASLSNTCRWRLQEAELFWAQGELETGKHMMKILIHDLEKVCAINLSLPCCPVY